MALRDLFRFTASEPIKEETKDEIGNFSVPRGSYHDSSELDIKENKSDHIYNFGRLNDFPRKLVDLYDTSPTNQAIVNRTALMIAGGDIEIEGEGSVFDMVHAISLKNFANSRQNLYQVLYQIAFDLKLHGRYGIECIWNEDHSKIVQIKRVDAEGIRVGLMENGEVTSYYWSEDWKDKKAKRVKYAPFDKYGEESRQLLYFQLIRSGHEVYGLPDYYASLKWIDLESQIGAHYLDSALNGFSPKLSVVFPAKPESEEIEDRIMKRLNEKYTGSLGKKVIGIFAPRPELKPEFNPINVENLDKQYQVIDEQTQNKILTGHGVVSPMLFGIKTPGQLGGSQELETAFSIYQSTVVSPYQDIIERSLNSILEASGSSLRFSLSEFEIINKNVEVEGEQGSKVAEALNKMSPLVASKVLDNLTQNEIRALGGLEGIEGGDLTKSQQEQQSQEFKKSKE
jgi:hypothetical protein